ncbi:non-ribosomal peptide synthetase [Herbidospora yilanensis]|uniref:non-ribosomal peptide synthetase n=1 Tax=Herbidospora yilanensis TaxID=354426 RepID=UPI000780AA69|nr:non-ribosomal peptide synthetase [Herbidospora yilanensis]
MTDPFVLHELVAAQARATPSATAVSTEAGSLTYAELDHRADRLAGSLAARGVGRGDVVAVCLPRGLDLPATLLGVLKAGAAYLPLDPDLPPGRIDSLIADAEPATVITAPLALADTPVREIAPVGPDDLAYVIYTSGSTGKPKGVAVPHRGIVNLARWHRAAFEVSAADRGAMVAGLGFDAAAWELWANLVAGACVCLPPEEARPSAELMRDWLVDQRVTVAFLPTPLAERAIRLDWPVWTPLRVLLTGGAALHHHPSPGLPFTLVNNYGPTEYSVVTTSGTVPAVESAVPPSLGLPITGTRVEVLDEDFQPASTGELFVGGEGLARGYWRRPGLTADRFVPDPSGSGGRLYRTGDRVRRRADGTLEYLGRLDDQIKLRGYRIEPGEIEAALREEPGVEDAVVVLRNGDRLVGYVTGTQVSAPALRTALAGRLPGYMVPSAVVVLATWPLTPNGKIDKDALPGTGPDESGYRAPSGPAERILADIYAALLGLPRVGVDDDFFALGGDSIVSLQIVARARRAGLAVDPRDPFDHPTIARLARALEPRLPDAGPDAADQPRPEGEVPLTPVQRWWFGQEPADPHHFNQTFLLELREPVAPEVLEEAINQVVGHHDALRLRFVRDGSRWRQEHAAEPARVVLRLPGTPCDEGVVAAAQAGLDLAEAPLVRAVLFADGVLLLVVHHLVVDGVSWRVLIEDLETACAQLRSGEPVRLPAKTMSFQTWSRHLAEHAPALTGELGHWHDQVPQTPPALPFDLPGRDATVAKLRRHWDGLDERQTRDLLTKASPTFRTEVNDVLLTAFAQAFRDWTGSGSLFLNLEGHGREPLAPGVDVSRTVGWFTSVFPVLLGLGPSRDDLDELSHVREQLRRLPRRGVGFGVLRHLGGHLADAPHPEVAFNYLGQFDASFSTLFTLLRESGENDRSPRQRRPHLLEVDGYVSRGRLRFCWAYSEDSLRESTVRRLSDTFVARLRAYTELAGEPAEAAEFPLARLSRRDAGVLASLLNHGRS